MLINFDLIKTILRSGPPIPYLAHGDSDELFDDGLTMGTLYIGRSGTGKTSSLARNLVDYARRHMDRAMFILDWSGSISDNILKLILQQPLEIKERLLKRVVYDEIGNPDRVIPLPEFSHLYGASNDEQVQRMSNNLVKLSKELTEGATFLGGESLKHLAPAFFKLLTAITNEHGEPWQLTETKRLIKEAGLLTTALRAYGHLVPDAKWYLQNAYVTLDKREKDLRTAAILSVLTDIEAKEIRARLGYYRPGWTPKEAIMNGLIVLVNGARLINQKNVQHYLFTQVYSLIMQEINHRQPDNPQDRPVSLVMDEVYSLLSIPGMAEDIGMLPSLYRSRNLKLYVVLQALSQLAPTLREKIWSIGNVVCFAVSDFSDAYEIAQQLFRYSPTIAKLPPLTDSQRPIVETDRGQYLTIANWIQQLEHRECIMRRYVNERTMEKYVRHVAKTKNHPQTTPKESLSEIKDQLLKERGIPIRDALEVINQREIVSKKGPPQI